MALTDENGMNTTMLVSPAGGVPYGNNSGFGGFGDNGWWVILLLLLVAGGWNGNNGFGGNGGAFVPYMMGNCGNDVQRGFDQAAVMGGIGDLNSGIFGIQNSLCNGFAGVNQSIANGFAQAEIAENGRQMANMNQMFNLSSSLQNCCCENRANIADLKYTVATENCADRTQSMMNTRDIIESQTRSTQLILDKLCQQEIDALKSQNIALQNELNRANLRESQTAQNAFIQNGFAQEIDALYNRLNSCPVPTTPVYGRTPIFTCNQNQNQMGCGCGCGVA
jgi:hypothetical protein